MLPVLRLSVPAEALKIDALIARLRLDPRAIALGIGERAEMTATVLKTLQDVAARGDAAVIDSARQFDDPDFTRDQLRVSPDEMAAAAERIEPALREALRRAVDQVRDYQLHILPKDPPPLRRGTSSEGPPDGRTDLQLGLRFSPLDSAGVYFPGGKASYPSSLIMLAVPAQVAGVRRIVVCTPASKFGKSDVVLAAAHEAGITEMYRCGGAAAIGALAFGTETIRPVDKIVGPGNNYVQLAKRLLAGSVGIDGYLGPSEILTIADETANAAFIAADLLAQAEHDPGSCFLATTSQSLAGSVLGEIDRQLVALKRRGPIEKALRGDSMIVVDPSIDRLIELANRIACEHVNLQTRDNAAVLRQLRHAGAVYVGPQSPVAAGDYVAGPSHCLPTNTTARFASGISVYEFMKRTSIVEYDTAALANDAPAILAIAGAEQLDAHAASVRVRLPS